MKVTDTRASGSRTTSLIDLELDGLPDDVQSAVKNRVGEFLVEQVLRTVGDSQSPVAGESWPALSTEYKKRKSAEGGTPSPNMELHGDMLASLDFEPTDAGIELGIFGSEAPKADGHNNFSGDSHLAELGKQRRFLPDAGQLFRSSIQKEVEAIVSDAIGEAVKIKPADLAAVNSKAELYEVLEEFFSSLSRAEIRNVVLRSADLLDLLEEEDVLDFL